VPSRPLCGLVVLSAARKMARLRSCTKLAILLLGAATISAEPWQNWGGNDVASPALILSASTEEEVVSIVRRAVAEGRRLKVIGCRSTPLTEGQSYPTFIWRCAVRLSILECSLISGLFPSI
jgi:hypothetical protein